MPESPEYTSNITMSNKRAQEIVDFIENEIPTKFCNVTDANTLKSLAYIAYDTLGKTIPGNFYTLLESAEDRLDKKKPRLGLEISEERAKDLVGHLLQTPGMENPHFRKEDTVPRQRELLRMALARVAGLKELLDGAQSRLIIGGERLIEQTHPLSQ